ncbi:uncharacterized protein BXZ73DRAFT_97155 [Epithele typhae]|uniref:uncharacterized protein n=1 Tax=Epithele typhae TaxID=378194 RepID=UPI002008AC22|nr:uncharacterized protein BXZ73DRAFT_97155 [Epithele typhae]KAH9943100.1 hypothetical protein BXZ73DRAFT_97155 [Epithele typhae]
MALQLLPVELLDASATRLLYRHLTLSDHAHNLSLLSLLASHPHLAAHVRTFTVHLDDVDSKLLPEYAHLQSALRIMTNISGLSLYVDCSASWVLSPPVTESSHKTDHVPISAPAVYSRLEHLTCNFPPDAHLTSFLGHTPSLISLALSSVILGVDVDSDLEDEPPPPPRVQLPPSHIPLLETYTGPAYLLPTLVSRPLKALHLSGDLALELFASDTGAPSAAEAMLRLRRTSARADHTRNTAIPSSDAPPLQVMSAMSSSPPAALIDVLARVFPNIQYLRLATPYALSDFPSLEFYPHIAETLSTLPNLSVFELGGRPWDSRVKPATSPYHPPEKEWLSPSTTPRGFALPAEDELDADRDYDFDGAFADWSY